MRIKFVAEFDSLGNLSFEEVVRRLKRFVEAEKGWELKEVGVLG